jgi:hypothetical protein
MRQERRERLNKSPVWTSHTAAARTGGVGKDSATRGQQREAKLGATVLPGDQVALIADQRTVLDQVTKLKRRAFRKRSSSR